MYKTDPRITPSSLPCLSSVLTPQLRCQKLSQPQLSQEAFLQGLLNGASSASLLKSPSCLPGHLVKPGTGPRESPGSLLYRQGTGDERSSWVLRYRCGVGTTKSFCISSGKFSSFISGTLFPGHFLDPDLTVSVIITSKFDHCLCPCPRPPETLVFPVSKSGDE